MFVRVLVSLSVVVALGPGGGVCGSVGVCVGVGV